MEQALLSVGQLVIATLVAALAAYLSLWVLETASRRLDLWSELARGNVALGVVAGAGVAALSLVLRPAIALPRLPDLPFASQPGAGLLSLAIQLAIALVLGVASLAFAVWLFTRLTGEIDEVAELKKGNLAIAALLAGTLIGVALMAGVAVEQIGAAVATWIVR